MTKFSVRIILDGQMFEFFQVDRKKWAGGDTAITNLGNMPLQETASAMEGKGH